MHMFLIVRLIKVAALFATGSIALDSWTPSRVTLIDGNADTGRYLVVGSIPMTNMGKNFEYQNLTDTIRLRIPELPPNYYLSVVSALAGGNQTDFNQVTVAELQAITTESAFFASDTTRGRLMFWPSQGDSIAPSSLDDQTMSTLVSTFPSWQADGIWHKSQILHTWLQSDSEICFRRPAEVIYMHCT